MPANEARQKRLAWFREAGYGIFVHYLAGNMMGPSTLNSDGVFREWNTCVDAFDVDNFAKTMKRMGAGYVVFTTCQGKPLLAAPNEVFESWMGVKPGEACARRDLIMDIADALERVNIPLMLYYTGDGPSDPRSRAKGGFRAPIPKSWVENWAKVLECWACRYGTKVKGWWIDGCYVNNGGFGYTPEKLRLYERAIRKGNPDAIIAFNRAEDLGSALVDPYMPFQDFAAGEKYNLECLPPKGGLLKDGTQWHVLTPLGENWGRPGVKLPTRQLADYLYVVSREGGVVTLDVMIYWDGSIERGQVNTLAGVRKRMAELKASEAAHKDNLAYLCPARCLSVRGTPLPIQREPFWEWKPMMATTDGDLETKIQGCYEWPWQLEIDLLAEREFSSVVLRYYRRSHATRLRVSVSTDGESWTSVAEMDNDNDRETHVAFPSVKARYVRVLALKPDGPNQRGGQMSIAEIEVYKP